MPDNVTTATEATLREALAHTARAMNQQEVIGKFHAYRAQAQASDTL